MHIIDRHAYTNKLRQLDPAQKGGLALLCLLLCLLLNRPLVGLAALCWMSGLAIVWAGVPIRAVGRALLDEALFLALAVVGVAIGVSLAPPVAPWRWQLGPLWLSSNRAALETALLLLSRALGGASAMTFLALTTPLVDLIDLLRRVRVPELLIDLMTLIYRFIFTLLESLERMRNAQECRLGYRSWGRAMRSAGTLGSRLFIDAYQHSQRLSQGLASRGYDGGSLLVLPQSYRRERQVWWIGAGMVATMLLAWRLG